MEELRLVYHWLLIRGRGGWADLLWGVRTSYDEIIDLREYLNIPPVVHHYYIIIIRAVIMYRCLIRCSYTLFLSRLLLLRIRYSPTDTPLLGVPTGVYTCFFTAI